MSDLTLLSATTLTMSSLEIAELTGKQHKNVLADVRNMLDELKIDWAEFSAQYKDTSGKANVMYNLPKRECLILVSGYSAVLRAKIVDRWLELEGKQNQASLIPDQIALVKLETSLKAFSLLGAPSHCAKIEAVKYVRSETGVDYSVALTYAPSQDNIPKEEIMLEPTELGKRYGMSAIALNRLLADHGYQRKTELGWEPTELGKSYCFKHSWNKRSKSGYNLKWRADLPQSLLSYDAVMTH